MSSSMRPRSAKSSSRRMPPAPSSSSQWNVAYSRRASPLLIFLAFLALMIALHLPLLKYPFHWDELGQFAPASLDVYQDGSVVAHSTVPNVHPPGVMVIVGVTWRIFGESVAAARVA